MGENKDGLTDDDVAALLHAAQVGPAELMDSLLDHDPTFISATDSSGRNVLHIAANHGHDAIVAQLLVRQLINTLTKSQQTPLHLASENGHHKVVALLLAQQPSLINAEDDVDGSTALHLAATTRLWQFCSHKGPPRSLMRRTHVSEPHCTSQPNRVMAKLWRSCPPTALH